MHTLHTEFQNLGKNILPKEELGSIGGEDVDTMFILRNMLNKQAEAATDEAVKADLYAQSRIIALNLNNVAHRGGETVQSFSKWTRTFDGMMTVAEGRLQRQISDVLENNPHMKAEIDTMAHKIFDRIGELVAYLNGFENLYCIGRNGQHRYNNMDHSMATAFAAVEALEGRGDKAAVWKVNTEQEYHEEKK